jgi:hypothetical protein
VSVKPLLAYAAPSRDWVALRRRPDFQYVVAFVDAWIAGQLRLALVRQLTA